MSKKINIGIAGLGTVGCGVIDNLLRNKENLKDKYDLDFNILGVSASNRTKKRSINIEDFSWFDNPLDLAKDRNIDLIIELIGGEKDIAFDLAIETIKNKKGFITANKALISTNGKILSELSGKNNVFFGYEAAVAGGIPIIKTLKSGLFLDKINDIFGILNGTSNFILSRMNSANKSFDEALIEAQELGYAEADPSFDVDGVDAAQKLSILSAIAFGISPDINNLSISGIREVDVTDIIFAQELGYRIKLLASSKFDNGLVQEVSPCMISLGRQISNVEGVLNAVDLDTELAGSVMLTGYGAGAEPTATAVLSDIITVAQGKCPYVFGLSTNELSLNVDAGEKENYRYYFRLNVIDKSGVLAGVTEIFRKYSLSIESLIQRGRNPNEEVPVIITTHETDFNTLQSVMEDLSKSKELLNKPVCMKII